MFPQLSETFIASEILGLERLGVPLRIFSYRQPRAPVDHECVRAIRSPITYLPDPLLRHPFDLVRANAPVYGIDSARYRATARYVLGYTLRQRNPDTWRRFLQAVYLAGQLHGSGIERLHAHMAHGSTRVAMLTSMLTGLPFSFTAHARDIFKTNPPRLRERTEAAQFVVTCTRANQEYLRSLVEPRQREKILLGYHGVDAAKFTPIERPPNETPVILSVGRLVEKKGFPYLLDALALLKEREVAFRCKLIGDGPELKPLRRQIHDLDLAADVELPGAKNQEEVLEQYRRADVFVLPSIIQGDGDRDGIPNVLLEAMATGLPVVSTSISGIPELVRSGENGLLAESRNARELSAALELLLSDRALRERIAKQGRETVTEQFSTATTVRWLARLFSEGPAAAQDAQSEVSLVGGN
jgi:glycosyltransferase involved in cell wall biosynthesis